MLSLTVLIIKMTKVIDRGAADPYLAGMTAAANLETIGPTCLFRTLVAGQEQTPVSPMGCSSKQGGGKKGKKGKKSENPYEMGIGWGDVFRQQMSKKAKIRAT